MTMYLVMRGEGATTVNGTAIEWRQHDCFMLPPWQYHAHRNASDKNQAILFTVSDRPALESARAVLRRRTMKIGMMGVVEDWSDGPLLNPLLNHSITPSVLNSKREEKYKEPRSHFMPRKVTMISGDSHLDFSPERWTHRVPEKWRDARAAPDQIGQRDDAFIIENRRPHSPSLQITGTAGRPTTSMTPEASATKAPAPARPGATVKEQDQDGVDAEILYTHTQAI